LFAHGDVDVGRVLEIVSREARLIAMSILNLSHLLKTNINVLSLLNK
jgi:hypothetical protein